MCCTARGGEVTNVARNERRLRPYVITFVPPSLPDQAPATRPVAAMPLAFSKPILDELLSVLARKFARDREELARVAVFLSNLGELVEPAESLEVLADETDNRILECALAAKAQAIVTGDRAMLPAAGRSPKINRIERPQIRALALPHSSHGLRLRDVPRRDA